MVRQYPLELSPDQVEELSKEVLEKIVGFYSDLEKQATSEPKWNNAKEDVRKIIEHVPPEEGTDYRVLVDDLFSKYIPPAMNFPSPGYMGFMPSSGMFQAALGDFIAKVTNRHVGHSYTSPFLTQIESNVIRWFAHIVGYPKTAKGILTSGGSIANLTAVIAARTNVLKKNFSKGVIYASDQTHHSVHKAAFSAGIEEDNIRIIPSDNNLKIDTSALKETIKKDKEAGLVPFMIVGNAGTTNTGTIDPLHELALIAKKSGAWFHVDAAYGGFFALTDEGKTKLTGMKLADSIIMDPLKSFFLPLGIGSLIVREGKNLDNAFTFTAHYFPEREENNDFWDPAHMSLELSRTFRGLSVWLPVKMHGISAFRKTLQEKIELAKQVERKLSDDPRWEVLYPPELSLQAISAKVPGKTIDEINKINEEIIEQVKRMNRVYLTGTVVKNRTVIRISILNLRTHEQQIQMLYEDLNKARDTATNAIYQT